MTMAVFSRASSVILLSNTLFRDWLQILAHFSHPIRRQPAVTCSLAFSRADARAMIGPLHFLSNVETGSKRSS